MSADPRVSHVAFPRRRDTRQTPEIEAIGATTHATVDATTPRKPASLRDLARDTLTRHQRDKAIECLATNPREPVAHVASVAHVAADLIDAIHRCCDIRGDSERNRAALLSEIGDFDQRLQADLVEHFDTEADRWHRASRGVQP